jgi:hypothetical protein
MLVVDEDAGLTRRPASEIRRRVARSRRIIASIMNSIIAGHCSRSYRFAGASHLIRAPLSPTSRSHSGSGGSLPADARGAAVPGAKILPTKVLTVISTTAVPTDSSRREVAADRREPAAGGARPACGSFLAAPRVSMWFVIGARRSSDRQGDFALERLENLLDGLTSVYPFHSDALPRDRFSGSALDE